MHKLIITTLIASTILFPGKSFNAYAQTAIEDSIAQRQIDLESGVDPGIGFARGHGLPPDVTEKITNAGGELINWINNKAIDKVLFYVNFWIGQAGATLFIIAGLLVQFGLFLNTTILDSQVVQIGWRFCRDLANLGFTIGIIVIAYATMLGIESYGLKTLFRKFLVAAVLVNFSFSIAGVMIDGSNLLTNFFVSASIGGGISDVKNNIPRFGEKLAGAFGPQRLLRVTGEGDIEKIPDTFRSSSEGMWGATLSIFFIAFFTIFCALGMLSVGITMFWRFAYLSGLVIVMPLAILASSFPDTQKNYNKWKDEFFCHLIHIPTLTFFLYLIIMFIDIKASAGLSAENISAADIVDAFEKAKGAGGGVGALALMAKPFQVVTDMTIILVMVFMGVIESRKVGCAAGGFAIDWMKGVNGWAIGTIQGAPGWAGRKYLSGGVRPEENKENRGKRLANALSAIPLVRRLVPRLNQFTAGTTKNVGNFETEYKGLGDIQLLNNMRSLEIRTNAERMAAAAKVAAERGLFSETDAEKGLTQKEFESFIPSIQRYGMEKDILKKLPYLYKKFGIDPETEDGKKKLDGFMKDFKADDIPNLTEEAFADPEIVSRFTSAHLEKLPKKKEYRDAFAQTFIGLESRFGPEKFGEFVAKSFSKPEADNALLPALLQNPIVVKNLTAANLKRLEGSDKEDHRKALIETINDTNKISDKEFTEFVRTNFAKASNIDEIHPDIIRNKRFFAELDERHIARKNIEPSESQQEAMIESLRESYRYLYGKAYTENETPKAEALARLDRMAKVIIEKKNDWQWSTLVQSEKAKESFAQIESHYRDRNPENPTQNTTRAQIKDDDAYGPSAPPIPPPKSPYPPAGGGPSAGNEPPKPPLPPRPPIIPKSPYPAGGGGPSIARKPTGASEPIQTQKSIDIGAAMDSVLGAPKSPEPPSLPNTSASADN